MTKIKLGHVITPIVTPKERSDFLPLIDYMISNGVTDIVLFATTGEGKKIELEEKKKIINTIVPHVKNRARLYVGLFGHTLEEAFELGNFCHALGFTAGLFPPLLYGTDVTTYVRRFLKECSIPCFLYNAPGLSRMNTETVVPWIHEEQIIGIKESLATIEELKELVERCRSSSFTIYYGKDDSLKEAFELGIDGFMSGTATAEPNLFVRLWNAHDEASFTELKQLKSHLKECDPNNRIEALKVYLRNKKVIR